MKIRTAIFLVYLAATAVGFAVLMRFVLIEVRPRYFTAVRQNLQDTSRALAAALRGRTMAQARAALSGSSGFRVRLVATDGAVLFDSMETDAGSGEPSGSGLGDVLTRGLGERVLDSGAAKTEAAEVAATAAVRLADEPAARLVLSRSFRSLNAVIWIERRKLAGVSLRIATVMAVAGWWIAARLSHSLERLTDYARLVRDGKRAAPPASRATEIAELSCAFEEMREALEGRRHAERYTQALAHEVKAPLAAIRGAAELMDEEMPADQRRSFLANIRGESARIQQIVERLLEEAVGVVRPACAAARVTLTVAGTTLRLRGERVLLREALVNLLQNALDFSPAGAEIGLTCTAGTEGRVEFAVEDNGPGVPDYALPRVFERFYSLPRPGTNRKSTGLGLALVREIAPLHGGEATLENRPGGGARATLRLPA